MVKVTIYKLEKYAKTYILSYIDCNFFQYFIGNFIIEEGKIFI